VIEITRQGVKFAGKKIPIEYVFVDGLGVGDIKEVVLRDRQMLAEDGIFVLIVTVDSQTGKMTGSPDIISRGFVYLRESQELLKDARHIIKKTIEDATAKMHPINFAYVKDILRDQVGRFLFQKTNRRPMVLPVIIKV